MGRDTSAELKYSLFSHIKYTYCPINNSGYYIKPTSFSMIGYSLDSCIDLNIRNTEYKNKAIKDSRFNSHDLSNSKTYNIVTRHEIDSLPFWWKNEKSNIIGNPSPHYKKKFLLYSDIYKPDSTFYKNICFYYIQPNLLGNHIGAENIAAFNDDTLFLTLDYADTSQSENPGNYNSTTLEMFLKKSEHTILMQNSYNMEYSIDSLSIEFLTTQDTIWPDNYSVINNGDNFIVTYNISIPKNEVKLNMSFKLCRTTEYGSACRRYYWPLLAIP